MPAVTRFGIDGAIWSPVGDFSGKEEGAAAIVCPPHISHLVSILSQSDIDLTHSANIKDKQESDQCL